MMLGLLEVRCMYILMRSLMLWVCDFMANLMMRESVTFLDKGLEVEITVLVITVEWLMVELVVL